MIGTGVVIPIFYRNASIVVNMFVAIVIASAAAIIIIGDVIYIPNDIVLAINATDVSIRGRILTENGITHIFLILHQ